MQDITEPIARYRKAVRHLWNTSFQPDATWDTRDRFSTVASTLFAALVLEPASVTDWRLPEMSAGDPDHFPRLVVVPAAGEVPILINREPKRAHGYWDDPVRMLKPGEADACFVDLFDWDELGSRDFQFVRVRIVKWTSQPHLAERYALLEFSHVRFMLLPAA